MARRIKQFYDSVTEWHQTQSSRAYQLHDPFPADLVAFPEVRAIVELPNETEVTSTSFQPVLPDLIVRWHADAKTQLGQKLRASYTITLEQLPQVKDTIDTEMGLESIAGSALVELASFSFVFSCSRCNIKISPYREIVSHWYGRDSYRPNETDLFSLAIRSATGCQPRTLAELQCKVSIATIAQVRIMAEL